MGRWKWFASDASNNEGIVYREVKIRNKTTKKISLLFISPCNNNFSNANDKNIPPFSSGTFSYQTVCSKPLDLLLENSDLKATVKKISTGY